MLINCPICGRQASDTTDTCVHCGSYLKRKISDDSKKEKIKFSSLTVVEQLKLENEYLADNYTAQAQKRLFSNQKKHTLILFASLTVILLILLAAIIIMAYLLAETDIFTTTSVSQQIINGEIRTVTSEQPDTTFLVFLILGFAVALSVGLILHSQFVKKCNNAKTAYDQAFRMWLEDHGYEPETSYLFT